MVATSKKPHLKQGLASSFLRAPSGLMRSLRRSLLNRVCLYGLWLSPAPWVQFFKKFLFNFNIRVFVSVYILNNVLESVGSGLGLLGSHPGPLTFW